MSKTKKSPTAIDYRQRLEMRHCLEDVERIAKEHHVSVADIIGRGRTATVARARKAVYLELRAFSFSYSEIGWLLGRDHTTVIAACSEADVDTPEIETIRAERDALRREVGRLKVQLRRCLPAERTMAAAIVEGLGAA